MDTGSPSLTWSQYLTCSDDAWAAASNTWFEEPLKVMAEGPHVAALGDEAEHLGRIELQSTAWPER
jgi:hypothetical protein